MNDKEKENIRTAIKNKNKEGDIGDCAKLLGSMFAVHRFGGFWEHHGDDMQVVAANALLDYMANNSVGSDDVDAYKKAQSDFIKFFLQSLQESEDNVRAEKTGDEIDDL